MKELTPIIRGQVRAYIADHPKVTEKELAKRFDLPLMKVREAVHG